MINIEKKNIIRMALSMAVLLCLMCTLVTPAAEKQTLKPIFSERWYKGTDGNWRINDKNGTPIKDTWVCDDTSAYYANKLWFIMDGSGKMIDVGLVRDRDGKFYSLETADPYCQGMVRYHNGYYDCNGEQVYLEFTQTGPCFGSITDTTIIDKLEGIYGLTEVSVDSDKGIYLSEME